MNENSKKWMEDAVRQAEEADTKGIQVLLINFQASEKGVEMVVTNSNNSMVIDALGNTTRNTDTKKEE